MKWVRYLVVSLFIFSVNAYSGFNDSIIKKRETFLTKKYAFMPSYSYPAYTADSRFNAFDNFSFSGIYKISTKWYFEIDAAAYKPYIGSFLSNENLSLAHKNAIQDGGDIVQISLGTRYYKAGPKRRLYFLRFAFEQVLIKDIKKITINYENAQYKQRFFMTDFEYDLYYYNKAYPNLVEQTKKEPKGGLFENENYILGTTVGAGVSVPLVKHLALDLSIDSSFLFSRKETKMWLKPKAGILFLF